MGYNMSTWYGRLRDIIVCAIAELLPSGGYECPHCRCMYLTRKGYRKCCKERKEWLKKNPIAPGFQGFYPSDGNWGGYGGYGTPTWNPNNCSNPYQHYRNGEPGDYGSRGTGEHHDNLPHRTPGAD